jgi:hypothetical protein
VRIHRRGRSSSPGASQARTSFRTCPGLQQILMRKSSSSEILSVMPRNVRGYAVLMGEGFLHEPWRMLVSFTVKRTLMERPEVELAVDLAIATSVLNLLEDAVCHDPHAVDGCALEVGGGLNSDAELHRSKTKCIAADASLAGDSTVTRRSRLTLTAPTNVANRAMTTRGVCTLTEADGSEQDRQWSKQTSTALTGPPECHCWTVTRRPIAPTMAPGCCLRCFSLQRVI